MTRLIKSSPYSGAKSLRSGTRTFTCAKVLLWCGTTLGAIALCLWVAVSGAKLRMTHHPLYLSPCPACASDPRCEHLTNHPAPRRVALVASQLASQTLT
jgi:hypothetical protein